MADHGDRAHADQKFVEVELLHFLKRKYVQRSDARQKSMGLVYMEAETHDLAKEITKFFLSIRDCIPGDE